MPQGDQLQTSMELGRNKILDVVKEMMRSQNVDVGQVLFRWYTDSVRFNQVLVIYEAKRLHQVRIADEHVVAWPMRPEVAGKYYLELVKLVERVKRQQLREEGGQGTALL